VALGGLQLNSLVRSQVVGAAVEELCFFPKPVVIIAVSKGAQMAYLHSSKAFQFLICAVTIKQLSL